ncbi:MAG TPA: PEP-CTERM sorting domain-containing protein [Bryobacteraceae bacterium]|nr:PEP-CTERM sorting domain-containing protein [Bryobacteraceae bacterium]
MKLVLIGSLSVFAFGQMAFATPELNLVSGADNVVVTGTGGTVSYSNASFNGWVIDVVFGSSFSPGLVPYGIDITSLTATCIVGSACSANPLDIYLSDTGFTTVVPAGAFKSDYSSTQTGGTTQQWAWDDTTNTIFGKGTSIGTVGPFSGTDSGSVMGGGPAGPAAYSLTIEDVFTSGVSGASFSTDGNISSTVPEPGAIILLGTVLAFCSRKLRRPQLS